MDIYQYNSKAWDHEVAKGSLWSIPVSPAEIAKAKTGEIHIIMTPTKPVPREWLGDVRGLNILCLASGGGQQGPILAAAGAHVTVLDASPAQLARDEEVAKREGLSLRLVRGDMRNLSLLADESFDFIIHPCSNCFIPDVKPVWRESFRVLKRGGSLISGFNNAIGYSFDRALYATGVLQLKYALPYSDLRDLTDAERKDFADRNEPLEFGHSLDDQIGGQIAAGFLISGFYEDKWGQADRIEDKYVSSFIVTRAFKPN